jgi:hypothetical protein
VNDPQAVPPVPEQALPPHASLALAQSLLDQGRAFGAHEVLEASWKAAPTTERDLWQGLAQPYGVDPALASWAEQLADRVDAGEPGFPQLRLRTPGTLSRRPGC